MEIKSSCACGQHVAVDSSAGGQQFCCPSCGQTLEVPQVTRIVKQSTRAQETQFGTSQGGPQAAGVPVDAQRELRQIQGVYVFLGILCAVALVIYWFLSLSSEANQTRLRIHAAFGAFWTGFYIVGGVLLNRLRSVTFAAIFLGVQGISVLLITVIFVAVAKHGKGNDADAVFFFYGLLIALAGFGVSSGGLKVTIRLRKTTVMQSTNLASTHKQIPSHWQTKGRNFMATARENEFLICEHCGNELTYDAEYHGMTSQCPHCNKQVVLAGAPRVVEIQHRAVFKPKPSNRIAKFWANCTEREKSRIIIQGGFVAIVLLGTIILALCGVEPFSDIVRAWFPEAWFPKGESR